MQLGLNVPNFGGYGCRKRVRDMLARAEATGFDIAMFSDHVALTPDVAASYPPPFLEPFTLLGWASAITERLLLGTTVTVLPYRSPLLVAETAETLDRLSGNRFILGVGVGWAEQEFAALGIDVDARGHIANDYLSALRALQSGDPYSGPHVTFPAVSSGRFTSRIWVGGNSGQAMHRAALWGDAWHPLGVSLPWLREFAIPRLRSLGGDGTQVAPRLKLRPLDNSVDEVDRPLGLGSWSQIEADIRGLIELGVIAVIFDPDTPEVRRGADPWPHLQRALDIASRLHTDP